MLLGWRDRKWEWPVNDPTRSSTYTHLHFPLQKQLPQPSTHSEALGNAKSRDWVRGVLLSAFYQLGVFVVRCSQTAICGASLKNECEANNTFTPGSIACFTAFSESPILLRLVWFMSERIQSFFKLLAQRFDKRHIVSLGRDKLWQSNSFAFCTEKKKLYKTAWSMTGQPVCVIQTVICKNIRKDEVLLVRHKGFLLCFILKSTKTLLAHSILQLPHWFICIMNLLHSPDCWMLDVKVVKIHFQ